MDDTEIVKVSYGLDYLTSELLYSFFSKLEIAFLDVIEKVLACHELNHYVVVF
jgi:hypothetical protein